MKHLLILLIVLYGFGDDFMTQSYAKSYNYEQIGRYQEALKVLAPIYEKYPRDYTVNLRFGWLYYLMGKFDNSLFYYKQASSRLPNAIDPKTSIMLVYLYKGEYKEVEKLGNAIARIDYWNYNANLYLSSALIYQGKYQEAITLINKQLNHRPTDVSLLGQLAWAYSAQNKKEAKAIYENILVLDPNNVVANRYLKAIR